MRLNFGCGTVIAEGWTNVDRTGCAVDESVIEVDAGTDPWWLPFDDDTFDYAVAHHVLDTIPYDDLDAVLVELRRVIKPRGTLRVSVADMFAALSAHNRGDERWFDDVAITRGKSISEKLGYYLTGYGTRQWLFTRISLLRILTESGFVVARGCPYGSTASGFPGIVELDSRQGESFYAEVSVRR